MQPVDPSTIVRGPAALTISFMTSADSQPWQVRCPEVKYSSIVTRLTPRNGSRICVAFVNVVVSAMSALSLFIAASRPAGPQPRDGLQRATLFPHAQPMGLGIRLPGRRRRVAHVRGLVDVLERHLAPAEPADERHQRRPSVRIIQGGPDLVGDHARAERRAE